MLICAAPAHLAAQGAEMRRGLGFQLAQPEDPAHSIWGPASSIRIYRIEGIIIPCNRSAHGHPMNPAYNLTFDMQSQGSHMKRLGILLNDDDLHRSMLS